jgi:hypothetical protein
MPAFTTPNRPEPEIDHRTMKLIVGVIAISLAFLTSFFATSTLTSISASYYQGGWSQSIFIGFLFAIASFLLAYNGLTTNEMVLSKLASVAGLCVALFPCACDGHPVRVPGIHYVAAAVMFLVLAAFCAIFYRRAKAKGHKEARARAGVYFACGAVIVISIVALAFNGLSHQLLERWIPRPTFYGEAVGLIAFGISWLMASHVLPGFNRADERYSLIPERISEPTQDVEAAPGR